MSINLPKNRPLWLMVVFVLILGFVCLIFFLQFIKPMNQKTATIGIARWVDDPEQNKNIQAFIKALADNGFVEDKNTIYIVPEPSNANSQKHREMVKFFVDKKVDLIYSLTTPGTLIAKKETTDIPIVFSIVTYPQEAGIVAGLKNSGNNLVGTRNWVPADDQLELFLEIAPGTKSLGFVHRKDEPNSTIQFQEFQHAASASGIKIVEIAPESSLELPRMLEKNRNEIDSLYAACDTLIQGEQGEDVVIAFAKKYKLPQFTCNESGIAKGSLIGLVADFEKIGNLAGEKAAAILKGVKPSDLETNTVSRPFIYVNKNTAPDIGINIPQRILLNAKNYQ